MTEKLTALGRISGMSADIDVIHDQIPDIEMPDIQSIPIIVYGVRYTVWSKAVSNEPKLDGLTLNKNEYGFLSKVLKDNLTSIQPT